jgi:hypothetical protein
MHTYIQIDVEGDELHVLMGIDDADWSKLKQVFIICVHIHTHTDRQAGIDR